MNGTPPAPAEWDAEHAVSAAQAAALVGGRFPALRGLAVEPLANGWDNTVFLVGGRWVFRFPRREIALPGVRREIDHLPGLARRLPLPIPVPEFVGEPADGFPWPFWGARLVPGRELAEAGLPEAARVEAAADAGAFLRALHDPGAAAEAGVGLPRDPFRRGDPSVRAPMARERLDRLTGRGLWSPDPATEDVLAEGETLGPSTGDGVDRVCHGDLHPRHLLVDADGRASGVIDWGDLCVADPAVDLSLAYGAFVGEARAAMLAAYGPVSRERELRARVLAVFICAALAEYAASSGHVRLLEESLKGIRRASGD
ncbi:phosphotransferase [Thermomonospora umbrina]|uniref:Aminoglycoside phosphotransferase (APT) family kinase protein n=1 Tax=Thermomonospora umbrina TaxID=111806 RepID=A0A3D9SWZ0_9ACTN|nr:phosphotransferase [Thermomonospora umbrina]REF00098.1 aminoglycoside phosphotransferase (APT) family kinase protein [Thermomonospora umbrina]